MADKSTDKLTDASPSTAGASTTGLSPSPISEKVDRALIRTNKKRRVAGSITPNACTRCKKARVKCDGAKPTCRRCFERSGKDCCYELDAKTAKGLMLREIRQLQHRNQNLEHQHKALLQRHAGVEQIIEMLKNDRRCTGAADRLRRGDNPQSVSQSLGRSTIQSSKALSPASEADLAAAVEAYHRDLADKLSVGQLSPGMKPTLAHEIMDEWQWACCPGTHGMNTQFGSPSEADDTERQKCMSINSLLNSD